MPLPDTFLFPLDEAVAFTGDNDPWVGGKESCIPALCAERNIPCLVVPNANQSLETDDVRSDLETRRTVMERTRAFITRI